MHWIVQGAGIVQVDDFGWHVLNWYRDICMCFIPWSLVLLNKHYIFSFCLSSEQIIHGLLRARGDFFFDRTKHASKSKKLGAALLEAVSWQKNPLVCAEPSHTVHPRLRLTSGRAQVEGPIGHARIPKKGGSMWISNLGVCNPVSPFFSSRNYVNPVFSWGCIGFCMNQHHWYQVSSVYSTCMCVCI